MMEQQYHTLLTNAGSRLLAKAQASATALALTRMAVGDGGGEAVTPTQTQTALINQRYSAEINTLYVDPDNDSQVIAELVLTEAIGDFWIREVGLFTADGTLFAVGNCPPSYKPKLSSGSSRTQTVRMVILVTSSDRITLKVDPSIVLATRAYVDDKLGGHDAGYFAPKAALDAKLDTTGKAADADKLDGHDAGYFATASAVASAQSSADGKVSKSGDAMTGRLLFNLDTPIEVVNEKIWDQRSFIGMAIAIARIPSIRGFWGKIYIEQNGRNFHAFTIQLHKDVNEEVFWTFRNDGHLYGPHGRFYCESDFPGIINGVFSNPDRRLVHKDVGFNQVGSIALLAKINEASNIPEGTTRHGGDLRFVSLGDDQIAYGGVPAGTWRNLSHNAHGDVFHNGTIGVFQRIA